MVKTIASYRLFAAPRASLASTLYPFNYFIKMGQSLSKKREANGSDHIRSEAQTGRSASKQQSPLPGGEVNGHPSNAEGSTELHLGTLTNPSTGSSEANKLNIEKTRCICETCIGVVVSQYIYIYIIIYVFISFQLFL